MAETWRAPALSAYIDKNINQKSSTREREASKLCPKILSLPASDQLEIFRFLQKKILIGFLASQIELDTIERISVSCPESQRQKAILTYRATWDSSRDAKSQRHKANFVCSQLSTLPAEQQISTLRTIFLDVEDLSEDVKIYTQYILRKDYQKYISADIFSPLIDAIAWEQKFYNDLPDAQQKALCEVAFRICLHRADDASYLKGVYGFLTGKESLSSLQSVASTYCQTKDIRSGGVGDEMLRKIYDQNKDNPANSFDQGRGLFESLVQTVHLASHK
ncbi:MULTISPECIES: hypothetical protein [unclassified Caballeronia]|uniref:hypothetical protein n=1 Tax=unclassified Caballeronia TaxID=2646786 RepID=UPI0020280FEA|nr:MULTISPECIES: hypothetical protein [unclassified Caballeronia]